MLWHEIARHLICCARARKRNVESRIGGSLFPCSLTKLSFVPMFPSKILKCSLEKFCHTKVMKLFCKTLFFYFQFVTSRKKAGSRLGHRAPSMFPCTFTLQKLQ